MAMAAATTAVMAATASTAVRPTTNKLAARFRRHRTAHFRPAQPRLGLSCLRVRGLGLQAYPFRGLESVAIKQIKRTFVRLAFVSLLVFSCARVWAATGGSISGTVTDQTGASVPGASVVLVNLDLTTSYKSTTDAQGFYSFPSLPVGRYELTIESA